MPILGHLMDRQIVTRAADNLVGVTMSTLNHSLPATNPQSILLNLRSVEEIDIQGNPALFAQGNASLITIGYAAPSSATCPTVEFEALGVVWHSLVQ